MNDQCSYIMVYNLESAWNQTAGSCAVVLLVLEAASEN